MEPLLLHDVAIDCQFVKEIDDHDDKMPRETRAPLNSMPRAGPRDLANQALRYGTYLPHLNSRPLAG